MWEKEQCLLGKSSGEASGKNLLSIKAKRVSQHSLKLSYRGAYTMTFNDPYPNHLEYSSCISLKLSSQVSSEDLLYFSHYYYNLFVYICFYIIRTLSEDVA